MKRFILRFCAGLVPAFLCLTAQAQTYKSAAAEPQFVLKAGQGTGKALTAPGSWGACISAAEAAALKAATKKDSVFTCDVVHGNVLVKYTAIPDPKPDVTWVQCALERQAGGCQFTGSREVRFGTSPTISGQYAAKTVTGPVECTNVVFGDPVVGVEKKCWTTGTLTPPVVTPPPVEPPPVTQPPTTPPSSVGGVPLRESFSGYPVVGQITATAGQVIERVRISTTSGPCIIVAVPNVTVRDVLIGPCGPGEPGKGLDVRSGASNLTVQGAYFEDISTALYANGAAHPIIFDRNYVTKIRGPMPRGQMVQLNNVKGGAGKSRVTCNVGDVQGQPNVWRNVEDWLNFYSTGGVEVAYNRLRGGGFQGYNGNNPSGTAVLFGDAAGGTDAWVHDNRFVGMTNVGIGVAGGVGARIERNQIHMDARLSGNFTNVGIYVAKYSSGACSGHSVTGNRVRVVKADGSLNPQFFAQAGDQSYCGTVNVGSPDSNVWNDTTLDPVAMFNTVPTQCQ